MKHSTHWTIGMVVLAVSTIANQEMAVAQVYDYEAEYSRLEVEITANMNVPPDGTKSLEPYLKAMALKSEHREKATMLYGSALADSSQWAPKLKALIDQAQESGDRTADTAAWWLLRIRSKGGGYPPDQWPDIIEKLRFFGRPLLTEARKFGFLDSLILDRATCMIRFAVNDLEVGHLGLYDGREKVFAELDSEGFLVIPDRDFDVDCEQRINFTQLEKGCPIYPTKKGLEEAQKVRDETEWWGFSQSEKEAIDLMEEFFRDTLCIDPISCMEEEKISSGEGLSHYDGLAIQYELTNAKQLVEDSHGKLYGKVEIFSKDGRQPATGAEVINWSPKDLEEWKTKADGQGEYEIEDVPLHKYCGPYEVEAQHEKGTDFREYEGPLEEPTPDHRHQEDLEIVPSKGVLEYHEKGGRYYFCEVEDESDFLEFKLIATADPCIYAIKGTTSPLHTHSEECEEPAGPATCRGTKTTYHEYERQTRITGGVVDLRDSERGPFRPSVEYRKSYKRCEGVGVDCYGNETRRDFVCTGTDDLARFGFDYVSGDGWMNAGPQLWMELKDGQKSRYYTGGKEQGLNYILHIDEAPFRRLEQRCDEYDASRSPFEPAGKAKEQN